MKKYTKEIMLVLIMVIVVSVISVSAAVYFNSENISFEPEDTNWSVSNTSGALNDLYDTSTTKINNFKTTIAQAITEMGVATEVDADAETMATNIRNISSSSTFDRYDVIADESLVSQTGVTYNNTFTATHNGKMLIHVENSQQYGTRLITVKLNGNVLYSLPSIDIIVDVNAEDQINITFYYGLAKLFLVNLY